MERDAHPVCRTEDSGAAGHDETLTWIFGEWDSFDPFRYEYVYRQASITVTSQVPVASVLNLTRRPIGLPSFDHGYRDRFDPQARGRLLRPIANWIRDKLKKNEAGQGARKREADAKRPVHDSRVGRSD